MKIALFGFGHLGKIHFKCLKNTPFDLVGIFDPSYVDSTDHEGIPFFKSEESLMDEAEACIIASSSSTHYKLALMAIEKGLHVFIEKPMTSTINQAKKLVKLIDTKPELKSAVGFVERFNPAFQYLRESIKNPRFIEVHRLGPFSNRGFDVSVVFDLMIHDLDLILSMKDSEIKDIKASGVKLISDSLDICNVRLEFMDFSVANITASRISMKTMRKFRIFQNGAYLSMDLAEKEAQIVSLSDEPKDGAFKMSADGKEKYIDIKSSGTLAGNAIQDELNVFYDCIVNDIESATSLKSALRTTILADEIETIALQSANL